MYWEDSYKFKDSTEYEYKFAGNYGAKGEKREPKRKATPEQVRKQNQKNRENYMRRKIKANFAEHDVWATLKHPKGAKLTAGQIKEEWTGFISTLRKLYRKAGHELKWINRMEIGSQGGAHIHVLVNRIDGTDLMLQECWTHGRVYYASLYEEGGYKDLAEYIVKQPDGQACRQLSLLPEQERKTFVRYSCSRNLIIPRPDRKKYTHWTMRKILADGPKAKEGYYIDRDSIVQGVNAFTGMSYLHYTEVKIKAVNEGRKDGGG
jgi:hypothetical protein